MLKHKVALLCIFTLFLTGLPGSSRAESLSDYSLLPPFVSAGVPPLVMLVLGRDHKLYYEAYNDISDLNGDGQLDIGYNPDIDYYGYFDSFKQYVYDSTDLRFEPVATTADKKVTADGRWSGDFLNYLTTSRMDALRKVLFGGYRSTDTTTETVLQRVFLPQDAHSWGKEYESVARDGYDISEYTPLDLPVAGTRHMFASTSLSTTGPPVLRVLPNNTHRIWEWVAKERPVIDSSLVSTGSVYSSHPTNHEEFEDLVLRFANDSHHQGTYAATSQINGTGNPFGADDYYLTVFTGNLKILTAGTYQFAVDGDDAVELIIDGEVVAGWYGGHGSCGCTTYSGSIDLTAGSHELEFRHQETTGADSYYLRWNGPDSGNVWEIVPPEGFSGLKHSVYDVSQPASTITDYETRVEVCNANFPEDNCKRYPNGTYKPIGILQRHGEADSMLFGLLTGSYSKNTSGGVLRKNISSINDEINATTGQFTNVNGIIATINKLKTDGYSYSDHSYNENCGWITTRAINEGECRMWGNPIGEMMYEGLRYFAGKASPTSAFTYDATSTSLDDNQLGLPLATWQDPYDASTGSASCAKPFMLVLSDINPSFDSNQLPGSEFATFTSDMSGMDVGDLADDISTTEDLAATYYIGQVGTTYDGSPSPKSVTTLGNIRGLAPEEPTKQGSYYSASVAYYGRKTDISSASGDQNVVTYSVALASPLPRIEIPVNGQTITLVPFAKSVGGSSISATLGQFQPTNSLVDFFVEELRPDYGKFRINFEDVEQGADHDMDAIVVYEYQVNADNTVTVTLDSTYAAGGIIQHMGYVISGTTADGTYLEVRDKDTATTSDPDYFLDTPPGEGPGGDWDDDTALPLTATRTFTPGSATAATLLHDPLWFAAKWGGFEEAEGVGNQIPDEQDEWDKDNDGVPDTYFYVTNPLRLEEQLNKSFADILRRTASGTAASVISSSRSGEGAIYQSLFFPEYKDQLGNTVNWVGQTHALLVDSHGNMREDTNANGQLDLADDLIIVFQGSVVYKYADTNHNGLLDSSEQITPASTGGIQDINFLWSSNDWLNSISDANILQNRTSYIGTEKKRYIISFADQDLDGDVVPGSGEVVDFEDTETDLYPFIHAMPPFDATLVPSYLKEIAVSNPSDFPTVFADFLTQQRKRVIRYIRGQDQASYTSSTSPAYTIPAFRSRQADYNNDGSAETWRLGDIVYSSPTIVGVPTEDYDLLYKDSSYTAFYLKYKNRRNVVYVGGNDGMLHAFNGGFYDSSNRKFWQSINTTTNPATFIADGPALGAELWAYVPLNLLPHLYWLTDPDYNTDYHVSYMDLKPRIFDAKIFPDDTDHPNGWGTVLVCGMRFGGGALAVDTNGDNTKADASGNPEQTMSSAYVVLDITNPEEPPTVLAEIKTPGLGFTTVYPTVIPFRDRGDISPAPATASNEWYLVFGSGPIDTQGAFGAALSNGTSNQSAKIYFVDLKKLASNEQFYTLDSSGSLSAGANAFASLDTLSFSADPISVDYNFDYKPDAVYFGTVKGNFSAGWGGKMRRIVMQNDLDAGHWIADSTLLDLTDVYVEDGVHKGEPIVASPAVALSGRHDRWVFWGTGRFFNRNDINNLTTASDRQALFGVKEPYDYDAATGTKTFTWGSVPLSDMLNTTNVEVYNYGNTVTGVLGYTTFGSLVNLMDNPDNSADTLHPYKAGWYRFQSSLEKERVLGQGALLGDILTFTSYMPSSDACEIEGNSRLYALYFKTGTAYRRSVIGLGTKTVMEDVDGDGTPETERKQVLDSMNIGQGMTITPNLHVGREDGSKAFLQTSTGAILGIDQQAPGFTKSGAVSWQEE